MNPPKTSSARTEIPARPPGFLIYWLLLLVISCGATCRLRAQELTGDSLYITGDDGPSEIDNGLTVNGGLQVDVLEASNFILDYSGIWGESLNVIDDYDFPLLSISADYSSVTFTGANGPTLWTWSEEDTTQMTLDEDSILTLYGDGGNNVVIDPNAQTITFASGLVLDGSGGNLSINGTALSTFLGSYLGSYVVYAGDGGFVVGNGASAGGYRSAAFGGYANAGGSSSVALANGTSSGLEAVSMGEGLAYGNDSMAMGQGAAHGNWSVALVGGNTGGNGTDGLAIGSGAYSNATAAIAIGPGSYSNGTDAMALGNGTNAQAWSSLTVGHYNGNITGNSTAWAATDPAFVVGIGNSSTRANGLVILNNGNATLGGSNTSVFTTLGDTILGNDTTTTTTVTGNLTVGGNLTGNVTMTGNVTISQPQGDIPMGVYGGD